MNGCGARATVIMHRSRGGDAWWPVVVVVVVEEDGVV